MTAHRTTSPWWTLAAVGIGTFMSALDGSVVNTILPVLRADLHATLAAIEWVTVVYLLVVSAILLGVGRAGDLYGHKRMYVAGFALFVAGSMLCGTAGSVTALVVLRGFQALGAAMLFANAPAILTKAFPPERRGRALGAQGTFTYLGLSIGPSLGGWLAHAAGWRWVFYINVPVGLVGIALALLVVADDRPAGEEQRQPFDVTGALLFTLGLSALLVALNRGHAWGWASPSTLGTIVVAACALAGFLAVEAKSAAPMLDLTLFKVRRFTVSSGVALLNFVCTFGVVFSIPFLLIQVRGLNVQQTGLVMTAQPIIMAIVAPFSGALSDRLGARPFATAGLLLLSLALALLSAFAPDSSLTAIVLSLGLVGFGVALFGSPNNSALMGSAPKNRQGIAAAVLATSRNLGMVLGVGLSGAIITTTLAASGSTSAGLVHGVQLSLATGAVISLVAAIVVFFGD